ncbi:ARF/SAR type [Hexamita inflata]|uniref:ARF/SAR type n=1 Tax=Hexamita inflata TaxID=28002 RepID=A0AA86QQZ5_9EUKA|nr:ARF/SAR type [Hexamita inflata]
MGQSLQQYISYSDYKILMLGLDGVGKTQLLYRLKTKKWIQLLGLTLRYYNQNIKDQQQFGILVDKNKNEISGFIIYKTHNL